MTLLDRHFLMSLSATVIVVSTAGWMLKDVGWLRVPLFHGDTFMGMILLAFALASEPTDGGEP